MKYVKLGLRKIYAKLPNGTKRVVSFLYRKGMSIKRKKHHHPTHSKVVEVKDYIVKKKKDALDISWVVPQPIAGSGGHRNIYRIVRYLANNGYNVTLYIDPQDENNWNYVKSGIEAQKFITKHFFDLKSTIIYGTENIEKCDVLFATHYDSAYVVKANEKKAKLVCYFIQDYEAYFSPMGYEYLRAHNSYKLGLYPITSGPWPLAMLKNNFGIHEGNYFRFPVDRNIYYVDEATPKLNRIVYFAKPSMPRRCYQLGVEALKIVNEKHPDWEIVFYGAPMEEYFSVSFEINAMGLVKGIKELGDLYRSAAIGIAFSTTNPSLVPYEMMCCGAAVIDLDFNNSVVSYDSSNNIALAEPTAEDVAAKINELIEDEKKRNQQVKNALEFCSIFPSELEMCQLIEGYILKELKKKKSK